jgi:hypothetical protein
MPFPPVPMDQNGAAFLAQMKELAKNFMAWVSEEGQEAEHPGNAQGGTIDQSPQGSITPGGGAVPMPSAPNEAEQVQPLLLRTRTTTVHDFTPPGGATPGSATPTAPTAQSASMATDPPVSQAQRGAMHAAAQGNSTLGIPQSVGKEFANADPGGKLPNKVADDGPAERFSLSPDGRTIIDNQGGKSYGVEEAMQILFSNGGQQQDAVGAPAIEPAGQVPISQPNTQVNTATWSMPKVQPPGKDRLGDGDGGKVLGQLLKFTSGEQGMGQIGQMPPRGGVTPDHGSWRSPAFARDYGTSEGAQKRGQGGAVKQAAAPRPQAPAQKPSWYGPGASKEDAANYEAQERNRRAR